MAVLTVIPATDVKLNDVRDTLNVNGGSVNNDLSTFFTDGTQPRQKYSGNPPVLVTYYPNAKINRWAKSKPINHTGIQKLSEAQIRAANFGLTASNFTTSTSGGVLVFNGFAQWSHALPLGGANSPYRLSDFCNYNPKAIPPLKPDTEISWNVADGGSGFPLVKVACRYDENTEFDVEFNALTELMQCECGGIIGSSAYLCLICESSSTPQLLVANAYDSLGKKNGGNNQDAFTIDINKFPIALASENYIDTDTDTYGSHYQFVYGLNVITNRGLGKVMYDSTLNAKTLPNYSTNDSALHYNGVHNNTFINFPLGKTVLDVYRYWLISWMYGVVGDFVIKNYYTSENDSQTITMSPNVTTIVPIQLLRGLFKRDVHGNYIGLYRGYADVEFGIKIVNKGASIKIGNKIFEKGYDGQSVTIDFLNNTTFQFQPTGVGHDGLTSCGFPKLRAWKDASNNLIYTQFEAQYLHNEQMSSDDVYRHVYNVSGQLIGDIVSVSDVAGSPATVVYRLNGTNTTFTRSSSEDVTVQEVGGKKYGIWQANTAVPGYVSSIEIEALGELTTTVRLRLNDIDGFLGILGIISPDTTPTEMANYLYYNNGLVSNMKTSTTPTPTYSAQSGDNLEGSCSTPAGTQTKAITFTNGAVYNFDFNSGDKIRILFTHTNTHASPKLNINGYVHPVSFSGNQIEAGWNDFYWNSETDTWILQ